MNANPGANKGIKPSQLMTMKIIWGVFAITVFVFGYVLEVTEAPGSGQDPIAFQAAFGMMALMCAGLGLWVPLVLYTNGKKSNQPYHLAIHVPWILRMVFFDQISIAGFLLAFLTGTDAAYWPFAAVTLVAYGLSFPSENRLKAIFD
ncbi:MAG TPA: hypothetical protein VFV50_03420 [Bdellovibrionales bacterium]|nr:hypothetical protein [Bdellovibrionales bacterium]